MTIERAHQKALTELAQAGYDQVEARATARLLLEACAGAPHAHLTRGEEQLSPAGQQQFEDALKELAQGRPLAYVLGRWEFYGLEFRCDERALIPRPETELLVEFALAEIAAYTSNNNNKNKNKTEAFRLADLGTGTGCIPIAVAKNVSSSLRCIEVYATDAEPAALALARENARLQNVDSRIRFLPGAFGDWASPLRKYFGSFDLLLSNPPYIAPREIETLQPQVREFEPRSALDGGPDGLDCYRQLARQCKVLLKPSGRLACELGDGQFEKVRAIFQEEGWHVEEPLLDFAGVPRVLIAHVEHACAE